MLGNRSVAAAAPSSSRSRAAELPSRQRARRTNDPLAGLDLNTARGRRIADLVRAYLQMLGNPADIERQAAVIAAAELQLLAEEARTGALKEAGHADLDQVIRLQGAADRAVRRLGLPKASPTSSPTLAQYLAAKAPAATQPDMPDDDDEAAG